MVRFLLVVMYSSMMSFGLCGQDFSVVPETREMVLNSGEKLKPSLLRYVLFKEQHSVVDDSVAVFYTMIYILQNAQAFTVRGEFNLYLNLIKSRQKALLKYDIINCTTHLGRILAG